jgi:gentisate 1,2-dioxygenase
MNAPLNTAALRQQLYLDMAPLSLTPLWEVLHALVPPQPASPCVPALWKYADVRPLLMRAGAPSPPKKPCAAC